MGDMMKSMINGRINSNIDAHINDDDDLTERKRSFKDEDVLNANQQKKHKIEYI